MTITELLKKGKPFSDTLEYVSVIRKEADAIAESKISEFRARVDELMQSILDGIDELKEQAKTQNGELFNDTQTKIDALKLELSELRITADRELNNLRSSLEEQINDLIAHVSTMRGPKGDDGYTPKKGVDYTDGLPGTPGAPGKDGSPDTGDDIVRKINDLPIKPNLQINASHIKNLPTRMGAMHGGGMSTSKFVSGEKVSGSGTTWTLANTPALFLGLYIQGQRSSTERGDYTISGATITTTLSWAAGDLEADYYK